MSMSAPTAVPRIRLHAQGPELSRLVQGLWRLMEWQLDLAGLQRLVEGCLATGITTFDHADIYGSYQCEERFGELLRAVPALRARLQLVSKCDIRLVSPQRPHNSRHVYDTSRAHIVASVERSLRNFHTDHLDLLLLHRPDPLLDADETAAALGELVQAGKVLHVGVSNFLPSQLELLASRVGVPLVTNQVELSVLHLDAFADGTLDQAQRLGMAPMAWSPLGGGALMSGGAPTGAGGDARDAGRATRIARVRAALAAVAAQLGGTSIGQVALAWLLRHPARIVPVLGSGRLERVQEATGALSLTLTREQWFEIWCASTGAGLP
jgi:predicted oxidoreductase